MPKLICRSCESVLDPGTVYCPFCGAEQNIVKETKTERTRRNRHNIPVIKPGAENIVPIVVKKDESKEEKSEEEKVIVPETPDAEDEKSDNSDNSAKIDKTVEGTAEEEKDSPKGKNEEKGPQSGEKENARKNPLSFLKKDELSEEEEKLRYIAYHDEVTGLLNRKAYEERLEAASQSEICVISADANDLKKTNDTMGHKYGDIFLKSVAESLVEVFGEDNCFRTGGDEFFIILEGIKEPVAAEKAALFNKLLQKKASEQEEHINMIVSIGIACGDGLHSKQEIVEEADRKMYENKRQIKGVYNPNHDGYYDDIKTEYEKLKKNYKKENIKSVIFSIGLAIAIMVAAVILIINM